MEQSLIHLLRVLNASQICAAARVLNDGRVEVWIGDAEEGIRASALFSATELGQATRWLSHNAVRFYPASGYARVAGLLAAWTEEALRAAERRAGG